MKKKLLLLTFVMLSCSHTLLFAWSREGHHIVVEIAYQLLSNSAREKLKAYLGNMSIEDAATWMDEQRGTNNQYNYLTTTHYINIEKGGKINPFQKNNIFTELNTVINELENPNTIAEAKFNLDLLILIHLVGDVHQPLHDGYGNDKGGNLIKVSLMGNPTNLHAVWDGGIISKEHINTQLIANNYSKLSAGQIAVLKTDKVAGWINESRSYLPMVYSFSNGTLDENYVQKAAPVIEDQLLKAGIRLSAILEKVLNNNIPAPIQQPTPQKTVAPITAFEAKGHTGEKITVCDKVYGTRFLENANGQPTFLNLGAAYPASPFTVVIFGSDRANFREKPELFYNNKKVCVTGLIKEYNGKPEMVLKTENEISVEN